MKIQIHAIGKIHSPYKTPADMPIQPAGAKGIQGTIELQNKYAKGLQDLEHFSRIIVIYHFHLIKGYKAMVTPFLDTKKRGLFSTRAPTRPNPIGLSILKLINIHQNILTVENIDIIDGTPLIDIKPYVPEFDAFISARAGWLEKQKGKTKEKRSDNRFV